MNPNLLNQTKSFFSGAENRPNFYSQVKKHFIKATSLAVLVTIFVLSGNFTASAIALHKMLPAANNAQFANSPYIVTNLNDSGAGSLRAAITSANAAAGADVIEFQQGLSGTINVASLMSITDDLTIDGDGLVTLNGQTTTAIFEISDNATGLKNITIRGINITGGKAGSDGGTVPVDYTVATLYGAISCRENLTLDDVNFTACNGGLSFGTKSTAAATPNLTLTHCTFTSMTAPKPALSVSGASSTATTVGAVSLDHCVFDNNPASVIFAAGTSISITNSSFTNNTGPSYGGAFQYNAQSSTALTSFLIQNVTVAFNTAGSGAGSAVFMILAGNPTVTINNSTFYKDSGNSTAYGTEFGFYGTGTVNVNNSIMYGGTGSDYGSGATSYVGNNYVATFNNCVLGVNSTSATSNTGTYNYNSATLKNTDPKLNSSAAYNGGFVKTVAFTDGTSPAINLGTTTGAPTIDARDFVRDGAGGKVDAGDYERAAGTFNFNGTSIPPNNTLNASSTGNISLIYGSAVTAHSGNIYVYNSSNTLLNTINVSGSNVSTSGSQVNVTAGGLPGNTTLHINADAGAFTESVDGVTATSTAITGSSAISFTTGTGASVVTPTTQAVNVNFSSILSTTATASWTNGTGSSRAVFISATSTGSPSPANNTTYAANAALGLATQIGTSGWYCIYNGTGSSVNITQLAGNTTYRVMVIEYNGGSGGEQYLGSTGTVNPANVTTASASTTISSLTAITGNTTNAGSVQWTATFAASVSGLSASDFTLNTSGVSGAAIASVSGSGTSWTITANTGSGSGTIQLIMNSSGGVTPSVSNATSGSSFAGSTYTIDKTAPTVSSITATSALVTKGTTTYTVTFSKAVTGVDATDFTATKTGTVTSGTITVTPSSSTVYTVSIVSVAGDGTLRLDLNSSGTGITDAAGNTMSGGFTGGSTYTIDNTSPTLSISAPTVAYANSSSYIDYTVTYNDANLGTLPPQPIGALAVFENLTYTGNTSLGSLQVFNSIGNTVRVEFHGITGDGTLAFTVPSGTASDQAGNAALASPLSQAFIVDNTPPAITIGAPSVANTKGGPVTYNVTYSDANFSTSTLGTGDITLNSTGGATGSVAVSGSGTSYTVTISSISGDGTLGFTIGAGTATDLANNSAAASSASATFTVDNTPPTVQSITATTPSNTNPTNATSVTYTVTFSEPVTGVDATDFTLTTSGTLGAVSNVSGSGSSYTVTVGSITGTGTLRLDLNNSGDPITDASGNALTSSFNSGDVYNIDNTAPTALTLTYSSSNANTQAAKPGDFVTLDFTASEKINTPSVTIEGNSTGAVNVTGNEWRASYTMTAGETEGRIPFTLSFTDLAGNPQPGNGYTDVTQSDDIEFDKTAPTATIGAPSLTQVTSGSSATVSYTVTYADANFSSSNLTGAGITLNTTSTATGTVAVTGSGTGYTVTISNITGLGTLGISLAGGYAFDNAGNSDAGASASATFNVVSGDATLSSLALSNGSLSPGFSSATTSYTAAVGYGLASINITPTVNYAGATLKINGTTVPSGSATSIPLVVGSNNVSIVVTAADGTTQQTYTIAITEAQSYNNNLASVKTSAGLAQGSTVPSTMTENVVNSISSTTVTPTVADPTATVTVNGTAVTSGQPSTSILLSVGKNTITIVVTAQDTKTQTYTITITRAPSANASLSNLVVSSGTLSPAFSTATNYQDYIANGIPFSITPTTTDPNATLTINGTQVTSGAATTVPLTVGNNNVIIVVKAQNGTSTKTYTVVVNEARSPNSTLFSLTTNAGFSQGQTVPTTLAESVPNATSTITVTPTMADNAATVTVNGATITSGQPSANLNLNVGANTITIIGTAQNGNITTYTLTVTRAASSLLTNLTTSAGSLNPAFAAATTTYAIYAVAGTTSTTITPTAADPTATIKVNGTTVMSGSASQPIALSVGNTIVTITVAAADKSTTTTYTVGINLARSPNNTLLSFATSGGLSQGQTVPTTLTESVPYSISNITITPTTVDAGATVTVNNVAVTSGNASSPITLSVGQNTITTVVTAQNGTPLTYTLTVTRAASANLSSLTLSSGSLSPAFATGTTAYSAAVGNGVTSITLTPTATGTGAVIKVNGSTVASGTASAAIPLTVGNNSINVTVTAADNSSTITYNVGVNRARSSNDALLSYKTSAGLAKGVPVPTTLTESVVNATSTITITPTTQDATATVTVNGATVASGTPSASIALNVGQTVITTVVTAQSGVSLTYTLTVTRAMGSMNTVYQPVGVTRPTADVQLSDDGINVHQGLSPNGDGINDFLQIDNISQYPDNNLKIMNRNGQLVYEAKGYDNATKTFDGHSNKNGQMQLPGTYFYSLDYTVKGIIKHKTGFLVLKY